MQTTTNRSITALKQTLSAQQTEITTLFNKYSLEQNGIFPLLQLASKHIPDTTISNSANQAIDTWITLHGSPNKLAAMTFTERSLFFNSLSFEVHKYKNPFAQTFKQALIIHWNKKSRTQSDYYLLELKFHEKNTLLDTQEDSATIYDKYVYFQIQVRANILFRNTEPDKVRNLEYVYGESFAEYEKECDAYFKRQLDEAPHFSYWINNILHRNGDDQLLALDAMLSRQRILGTPTEVCCLCAKILVLTIDAKEAAQRFHLTPQEVTVINSRAMTTFKEYCQKTEINKHFTDFCLCLLKNAKVHHIMQDRTVSTDTLLTAAITSYPRLSKQQKEQCLAFYAKGIRCVCSTKNIDAERLQKVQDTLFPPIRLSISPLTTLPVPLAAIEKNSTFPLETTTPSLAHKPAPSS